MKIHYNPKLRKLARKLRKTGIDVIADVPWGTHFCQFYQDKEDLVDILVPYFKAGLENNEFCIWITAAPLMAEEAKDKMKMEVSDFELYLKRGQIEIIPHTEWYLKDGVFNCQRVLNGWIDKLDHALARGYDGMRATGNTFWIEKNDWQNFSDYEEVLDNVLSKYQIIVICSYSLDKCRAKEIIEVVCHHKFALIKHEGKLEIFESTERTHAEEMLQKSEEQYRLLFERNPNPMWVFDSNTFSFLAVNDAAVRHYGYSREEFLGMTIKDILPSEQIPDLQNIFGIQYDSGLTSVGAWKHRKKDGTLIDVEITRSPVLFKGKEGVLIQAHDITESKRLEDELRKLSNAIEQSTCSIIITDTKGNIEYANSAFEQVTGYTTTEIIGQNPRILKSGETFADEYKRLWDTITSGDNWHGEFHNQKKNGEFYWASATISPVKDKKGFITHFIGIEEDITERKRIEQELMHAKESAEAATVAKSQFLANMSHEIRTPMNAIMGMTELALSTELTSEQSGYLKVVQTSSDSLLHLIDDILDFSKIEAGLLEIDYVGFNLRDTIENIAEAMNFRASKKGIELICYVDMTLPTLLIGDKNRLRQIIVNLVGNAIKFTEKGEVAIKVEPSVISETLKDESSRRLQPAPAGPHDVSDTRKKMEIHFMVSDTGIGISQADQEKLFKKFSQVDTSTTRKYGGTGLGLSISKALVELMGGQICVESETGKGSTFHFSLPFELQEGEKKRAKLAYADIKNISLLVVDDSSTNRFILQKMLSAWGCKIQEAESGAKAISILCNKANKFDVVILDHHMPNMDGPAVAMAMRKDPDLKGIKIVMLSSAGTLNLRLMQEYGVDEAVAKPVKQSELLSTIRSVLHISVKREEEKPEIITPAEVKSDKTFLRILLAEDNVDNQNLAKSVLKKAGYSVDIAGNGRLAADAVRKLHYDLILMDIEMPEMDGFAATSEIRRWEKEQHMERIPIVALTAHAVMGYREKCLEGGMDDYITKPLKKNTLLDTVNKWIDLRPTILVADDSIDSRNLINNYLKKEPGLRLFFANNGQESLDMLNRRSYSLVLMDMEMPVMDGYTAAAAIRNIEAFKRIPIIAMTAHTGTEETKKCLDAGCTDYISKPIRKDRLLEVIYGYIKQRQEKT